MGCGSTGVYASFLTQVGAMGLLKGWLFPKVRGLILHRHEGFVGSRVYTACTPVPAGLTRAWGGEMVPIQQLRQGVGLSMLKGQGPKTRLK